MADVEHALTALAIDISRGGPEDAHTMTIVVRYTAGGVDYEVTAPDIPHDEIRHILNRVNHAIAREHAASSLLGGDDFTVTLIGAA